MGASATKAKVPEPIKRLTEKQREDRLKKRPTDRFKDQGFFIATSAIFACADKFAPGGAQLLAVQWIMHEQFKQQIVPEWVQVSPRALERNTAGAYTWKAYDLALADASRRGLVRREKRGREWWYQVFPEDWPAALSYEVAQPVAVPAPEAAAPETAEAAAPDADIVPSGKSSKARVIAMKMEVPGVSEPVDLDLNFRVRNDLGVPLSCRPSLDGTTLWCVVSAPEQRGKPAEAPESRVVYGDESKAKVSRNQRLAETTEAIRGLFRIYLDLPLSPADKPFVARVADALGDAPVSNLIAYAEREIPSMRAKRGKKIETGIFLAFARQVKHRWDAGAAERAAAEGAEQQLIDRLIACGFTAESSRSQIDLWRRAGYDVAWHIAECERDTAEGFAGDAESEQHQ